MSNLFYGHLYHGATLLAAGPDLSKLNEYVGYIIYAVLGMVALWGAFCVVIVWRRVAHTRFRDEDQQADFLDGIDDCLEAGDFDGVAELCEGDRRAMPQLALLAVGNRELGYAKVRRLVADRFGRDVLADLEYRLSWVSTVIKTAPMVGLLGTVIGMMGAFHTLSSGQKVDSAMLAGDIQLALITTACGLAIAIPLVFCTAAINVRIRKMEDLVGFGLTRFFESFKDALAAATQSKSQTQAKAKAAASRTAASSVAGK
ncbi:MAG: MotA/TolQ/ExbB proton channel family protein [Planctomycetes bacterium]|nr:MotA/TolQ/ExbB proton channel family protein [Planctomycetota bacterium]